MTNELTKLDVTKKMVQKMDGQFSAALPKQIQSKKFVRTVLTAISDPLIADKINQGKLDTGSLMSACTKAASDGLLLDGREAALLTFYDKNSKTNKAQYIPMVAGLMKKARNSGEIVSITAKVVFENDEFDQWIDEKGEHFKYKPCKNSLERGEPLKVFALGITKDGGSQLEVLERADIDAIASHSKNSYQYDPQKGSWFGEWWKKAAIRRLCKYLPSSSELDRLFEHDNDNYDLKEEEEPNTVNNSVNEVQEEPSVAEKMRQSVSKQEDDVVDAEFIDDVVDAEFVDDDIPI